MSLLIIALKAVSHAINNHVLTGKSHAIHVLLMHGFCTLNIRILGHHKNNNQTRLSDTLTSARTPRGR